MDELLKKFTVEAMTEIIIQTKVDQNFITDTFFKKWTPTLSNTHNIIIEKGAGIILESVSENGEHLVTKNPTKLSSLYRFLASRSMIRSRLAR